MTSEKQIAANQKNAKKAGVKSAKGKAASSRNAFKHGILSRHLYVPGVGGEASWEELSAFQDAFFAEMQPVGLLETLLVDRLCSTF